MSELKAKLINEYKDELLRQENKLTNKYTNDLENEKHNMRVEFKAKQTDEIEHAITLAKVEWLHQYDKQKVNDINLAVQSALCKVDLEDNNKIEIEKINNEWSEKCKVQIYVKRLRNNLNLSSVVELTTPKIPKILSSVLFLLRYCIV